MSTSVVNPLDTITAMLASVQGKSTTSTPAPTPDFSPVPSPISVGKGGGTTTTPTNNCDLGSVSGALACVSSVVGSASSLSPTLLFAGLSWQRVATFLVGLIALIAGLYLFKGTQSIIVNTGKAAKALAA